VPDRIWDDDPQLYEQAEAERQKHLQSQENGKGSAGGAADLGELGEWDAGEDNEPIPPRGWLLGNTFCRRFLSALIGDGGVGKTALRIAQLLSLAIGRSLTGEHVFRRCRVLLVSLEDDRDELRRRVSASMLHHGVKPADVRGWLFLAALRGAKLVEKSPAGTEQPGKLESLLRKTITKRSIDVVSLDPFVKTHGLEENDNSAIDRVCDVLASIAIELNCAADLPHHVSKAPSSPAAGDANRGRGASAFKDAARLVYTLTSMSRDEREQFNIDEAEARRLVRYDSGKVNIAPPATGARWFRLVGVSIGNKTEDYPNGDEVQAVEPWAPPDMWAEITTAVANKILDQIEAGTGKDGRYSSAPQAGAERAVWRVVKVKVPDLTEKQCRRVIDTWLTNGVLEKRPYKDPARRQSQIGLFVIDAKRPG
jgi:hypothetical protein